MKQLKRLESVGMKYDDNYKMSYGEIDGYKYIIEFTPNNNLYTISTSVVGTSDIDEFLKTEIASVKKVSSAVYNNNRIVINVKYSKKFTEEDIYEMLKKVSAYCRNYGYRAYCQECGLETEVDHYGDSGEIKVLCSSCFNKKASEVSERVIENQPLGILGAFLGALIGMAFWVFMNQLGYVVAIAGYIMVVCCVQGYKKFAGTISKTGLGISFVIAIVMLIVSELVALGVDIYIEFGSMSLIESMRSIPFFLSYSEVKMACLGNLAYGLVFMLIAGFMYIKNMNREIKMSGVVERL